jgi:hypothetical protein
MKVVEEAKAALVSTREQLEETRTVMLGLLRAAFSEAADRDDVGDVVSAYKQMRALLGPHEPMPEALFNYVEIRMRRASAERPTDWSDLLVLMAEDARRAGTDRQEAWAYYLLLAHSALAKPEAFDQAFARFQATMAEQKRRGLKPDDTDREMVGRLAELVGRADQRRKQSFDRVVAVVRAP